MCQKGFTGEDCSRIGQSTIDEKFKNMILLNYISGETCPNNCHGHGYISFYIKAFVAMVNVHVISIGRE